MIKVIPDYTFTFCLEKPVNMQGNILFFVTIWKVAWHFQDWPKASGNNVSLKWSRGSNQQTIIQIIPYPPIYTQLYVAHMLGMSKNVLHNADHGKP